MAEPIALIDAAVDDLRKASLMSLERVPSHGRDAVIAAFIRNYIGMAILFMGRERARAIVAEIAADAGIPFAARRS
jgi:hypothetical protein